MNTVWTTCGLLVGTMWTRVNRVDRLPTIVLVLSGLPIIVEITDRIAEGLIVKLVVEFIYV